MQTVETGQVFGKYYQNPQNNPLRWRAGSELSEGVFTPETAWFMCKDYFNDIVGGYHGVFGVIYGFQNELLSYKDKLVVELQGLFDETIFLCHLELLNKAIVEANRKPIVTYPHALDKHLYIEFDKSWFECTYWISLVTYLIRISNQSVKHKTLSGIIKAARDSDFPFTFYSEPALTELFDAKIPEGFWWWSGARYNSNTLHKANFDYIHSCGADTWQTQMNMKKLK